MKNKTFTTWLALVLGAFGLHRFYLYGSRDAIAWLMPIPTALGVYGFERVAEYGLDDVLSWWLLPLLGFHLAAVCLTAIVYGLAHDLRCDYQPDAGYGVSAVGIRLRIPALLRGHGIGLISLVRCWLVMAAPALCKPSR